MKPTRSPEIAFLLLVCTVNLSPDQKAQLIAFLQQHSINWDRLYRLANRHRITPFLYRTLQQIPNSSAAFLSTLQTACQETTIDNLLKKAQYQQLAALLSDQAIDHLALKGVYLAESCYPDSSLRPTGDIDVLVNREDALRTIRFLESQQYQLGPKYKLYLQQGGQTILDELYEVSLFKAFFTSSFDIDLHWEVMCFNKDYKLFTLHDVISQPAFSAEMQVVLLVTHHGVNNVWQHIYYINDLYFLLSNKPLNWEWLMQTMRQYGLERVFLAGLCWCRQLWDLPLPPFVQEAIATNGVQLLANAYAKNWEADHSISFSRLVLQQVTFFTKAQTQFRKQLTIWGTFFSSRVFRSSTFRIGHRLLYIPKELGFITIFIRAIGSLYRFLPARKV